MKVIPFVMWGGALLFFTYQFMLRIFPGLLMDQIMARFLIDAGDFGTFAALYYYGYAGMQIPMSILLDKYGSRLIIGSSALICGAAMLAFSYSESWTVVCWSRFIIGATSAAGLLGVSKVVSEWFSKEWYPKMMAISITIGIFGMVYGGRPMSVLIGDHGWAYIAAILAACSMLIGVLVLLVVRAPQTSLKQDDAPSAFRLSHVKDMLKSPIFWIVALVNFLLVGALEGFGDIWGISYFMLAYQMTKEDAAQTVSFLFVGMMFGSPLLVILGRKIGYYMAIVLCGLGMAIIFGVVLSELTFNELTLSALCFVIGVLCCYQVLVFAIGSAISTPQTLGISIAFLNCINMLGGSFFHTAIGVILDQLAMPSVIIDAVATYNVEAYRTALTVIPICAILGSILMALGKSKAKQAAVEPSVDFDLNKDAKSSV